MPFYLFIELINTYFMLKLVNKINIPTMKSSFINNN